MVNILSHDRLRITLVERVKPIIQATPNWYNTLFQCFTNIRTLTFLRTHAPWTYYAYALGKHIYTQVGHEPMLTAADQEMISRGLLTHKEIVSHQRLMVDGESYIDEFGMHVYTQSSLEGPDKDYRYELGSADPELFTLELIEQ